jgi:hypothetical protein
LQHNEILGIVGSPEVSLFFSYYGIVATISKISDGTINFDSKSVGDLSEKKLQQLRGTKSQ